MRNQPPVHELALVNAFLTDDDGNVGRCLRGDVEARCVLWKIAVEVPANPNVTKLERSGEAATHVYSLLIVPGLVVYPKISSAIDSFQSSPLSTEKQQDFVFFGSFCRHSNRTISLA